MQILIYSFSVLSQLEGAYAKLKRFLIVSNGDLYDIVQNIENLIKNDINYHIITIARQRDRLLHNICELKFKDILTKVTPLCLCHLKDQLRLVKSANYQPNYSG